ALRRAVATTDEKALTAVPGIGKKGAQKLFLELAGRLGEPTGAAEAGHPAGAAAPAPWSEQLRAALVGLGYSAPEAEEAIAAVTPAAEAAAADGTAPKVSQLLRAALRTLNRAR
ncbi:Holliday junction branch migration protein RuvA, partial [Streptomyces sp. NPDC004051]